MFGLSGEHLLIFFGILLIFGPKRLPEAGRVLGKSIRNFREHVKGIQEPEFRRLGQNGENDAKRT
jgi:sec-independent protein translocase protein TatA